MRAELSGRGAVVAGVLGAAVVVAGYLVGGPRTVWVVAGIEAVLVMAHVARKFGPVARRRPPVQLRVLRRPGSGRHDPAHCERCRRAHEGRGRAA